MISQQNLIRTPIRRVYSKHQFANIGETAFQKFKTKKSNSKFYRQLDELLDVCESILEPEDFVFLAVKFRLEEYRPMRLREVGENNRAE